MLKNKKFIALYRVSTQKQGMSGLGLDAQKFAVRSYAESIGAEIVQEYTEIESGGNKDRIQFNKKYSKESLLKKRPVLKKVIEEATKNDACIIVKEASRLTRYPLLMEHIISQHINFVASDSPNDDTTLLRIKTALNAQELMKVSERTYNALQQKKIREGGKLKKKNNSTDEGRRKGHLAIKEKAKESNYQIWDKINDLRKKTNAEGEKEFPTLLSIAQRMSKLGYTTSLGKSFTPTAIKRLLEKNF